MFSLLSHSIKDASVLRRLQFAARFYPKDMPNYSEHLALFSLKGKEGRNTLSPEQACQFVENMEVIDNRALNSDTELTKEIVKMTKYGSDVPLGVILISGKEFCRTCGSRLYIRGDRTSQVTIYHDQLGTLPGTHYIKYCRKKGCSFQQHYGFYTLGDCSAVTYDHDWAILDYFMSTRETVFSMDMLRRLDKEILIAQISYKQRADLYNDIHGYCTTENSG